MALQTVDTIIVADLSNPTELQVWFEKHPTVLITTIVIGSNIFYVVYTTS
jgi:hypothetical protein